MQSSQCQDTESHFHSQANYSVKILPCQLLNLVNIIRKLRQIRSVFLQVIFLVTFIQQGGCHILSKLIIHAPDRLALKIGRK